MLKEVTNLNETSDNLKRRWFTGPGLDLYIWHDGSGTILEFQFSYNKPDDEHVVRWTRTGGLSHHRVHGGETGPDKMDASPVLGNDTRQPIGQARKLFVRYAKKLEHDLYEFILEKLTRS